ncbi:MAG: hypothetical protein COB53_13220, partial [Elusimicrobia bacterium]
MGNTREWTEAPRWAERSPIAARSGLDLDIFTPPSASQAAQCVLSGAARALAAAAAQAGICPEELLVLSSLRKAPDPFNSLRCYRVLGLGGRSLPFAAGAEAARASTRVVCVLSTARGSTLGWLTEAARCGLDATILVANGGRCRSSTSVSPDPGLVEAALRCGAGFVSRIIPTAQDGATVISQALRHKGLAVVDVISICRSHDEQGEAEAFAASARQLADLEHDATDYDAALARAAGPSNLGVFFDVPEASQEPPPAALEPRALDEEIEFIMT